MISVSNKNNEGKHLNELKVEKSDNTPACN